MTTANRYAKESSVPIAKTRGEIEALLRKWGCTKLAFLDDYEAGTVEIQFFWSPEGSESSYAARFVLDQAPPDKVPSKQHWSGFKDTSQKQKDQMQRGLWRTLLYWLRSCLDACDAGIIEPELVFLPWMVTGSGETVAEILTERMPELAAGGRLMLEGGQ